MIEIANLRKYIRGEVVRLEADINFTDMISPYPQQTIYFEIDKANGDMLVDDTCDAFVLVPLRLAMLYKQNLHIRGKISKRFYQNVKWYIQKIFSDFDDELSPVTVTVDGFVDSPKKRGSIVGAGISCGVDSLSTIYDHFLHETDPDYRINALFYFDCGIFGEFGENFYDELTLARSKFSKHVAEDLDLPFHWLGSNLHAFWKREDMTKCNYLAVYSCALALGNAVSKYYISSTAGYEEIKKFYDYFHGLDVAEFCESYLVPLIQTEHTELIIDGCQYSRVDKLKNIVDWDIARKYLNVCWRYTPDGSNCGGCGKCLRTLLALEIMGKLDDYAHLFDMKKYKNFSLNYKGHCVQNYGKEPFETELVDFARENNFPMPTKRDCYVLGKQIVIFDD